MSQNSQPFLEFSLCRDITNKPEMVNAPEGLNKVILRKMKRDLIVRLFKYQVNNLPASSTTRLYSDWLLQSEESYPAFPTLPFARESPVTNALSSYNCQHS